MTYETQGSDCVYRRYFMLHNACQKVNRVQNGGKPPGCESRLLDVYHEKPVRITAKVLVPVKEHPKFNFVGKLLGPKGNSMKRLQEETLTKMAVLGKGSMRNKQQENELRLSGDPKFSHLSEDLHVEISAFAAPAEAHARIAYALTEIRKYLIPDSNDAIRQEQKRELKSMSTAAAEKIGDKSAESTSVGEQEATSQWHHAARPRPSSTGNILSALERLRSAVGIDDGNRLLLNTALSFARLQDLSGEEIGQNSISEQHSKSQKARMINRNILRSQLSPYPYRNT